jgi:hypothetical protein
MHCRASTSLSTRRALGSNYKILTAEVIFKHPTSAAVAY